MPVGQFFFRSFLSHFSVMKIALFFFLSVASHSACRFEISGNVVEKKGQSGPLSVESKI